MGLIKNASQHLSSPLPRCRAAAAAAILVDLRPKAYQTINNNSQRSLARCCVTFSPSSSLHNRINFHPFGKFMDSHSDMTSVGREDGRDRRKGRADWTLQYQPFHILLPLSSHFTLPRAMLQIRSCSYISLRQLRLLMGNEFRMTMPFLRNVGIRELKRDDTTWSAGEERNRFYIGKFTTVTSSSLVSDPGKEEINPFPADDRHRKPLYTLFTRASSLDAFSLYSCLFSNLHFFRHI